MSNRTILIIAGLAVPVVALTILTQSSPPPKSDAVAAKGASVAGKAKAPKQKLESLSDAQARIATRLEALNKMTQNEWDKRRKEILQNNPNASPPVKIEDMRERIKGNLARLKSLTPEQWEQEARDWHNKREKQEDTADSGAKPAQTTPLPEKPPAIEATPAAGKGDDEDGEE